MKKIDKKNFYWILFPEFCKARFFLRTLFFTLSLETFKKLWFTKILFCFRKNLTENFEKNIWLGTRRSRAEKSNLCEIFFFKSNSFWWKLNKNFCRNSLNTKNIFASKISWKSTENKNFRIKNFKSCFFFQMYQNFRLFHSSLKS